MYKKDRLRQLGLTDFNQPIGLKMNPENRWVKKAETIPWIAIEESYQESLHRALTPDLKITYLRGSKEVKKCMVKRKNAND